MLLLHPIKKRKHICDTIIIIIIIIIIVIIGVPTRLGAAKSTPFIYGME
jgi:hypothetical protein